MATWGTRSPLAVVAGGVSLPFFSPHWSIRPRELEPERERAFLGVGGALFVANVCLGRIIVGI